MRHELFGDSEWFLDIAEVPEQHRAEVGEWLREFNGTGAARDQFGAEWACGQIDRLLTSQPA